MSEESKEAKLVEHKFQKISTNSILSLTHISLDFQV